MWGGLFYIAIAAVLAECSGASLARLVCYVEQPAAGHKECTHLVYAGSARGDKLEALVKDFKKNNPRAKILLRVTEVDKDLQALLKLKHVQGFEIYDAHKTLNKTKVEEFLDSAKSAITSNGGGPLFMALPANPELLAKYYDLRVLMKKVDFMMVQTHDLGRVKKMTYHPSRLSGLWDMMNTDSVVDLVVGLGVPASKIVISLPGAAYQFTLANETLSTPGSPTLGDVPKEIGQTELCRQLQKGRWTLERDQDLSAPYAFKDKTWIAFEDSSSVDIKGKYARVRGLAGLALHRADRDEDTPCGPALKTALAKVLNQQSRAPRAAILRSLEHEILSAPSHARALDALQVSPYRITQVVDSDGVIHSLREDTRTEFSCSRQGYFVHPRSCSRFYRCVKFDQLSPEYTVFEFDCPAGLAFDSRYEVCVWPGSLPHSQPCPGSSEIAPVPPTRFICPEQEGYYADPENCRWFFACLDHGKSPLTAYEFRCPFGLGFDATRLACDWPWLVPACGNIARYEAEVHGYSGALLTGAAGFQGKTADSVNIAAHQSLVSGASLDNLVGIQSGILTKNDALDSNFIASQELDQGHTFQVNDYSQSQGLALGSENLGLVQATKYNDNSKYTSGSLILDDYRLPTKKQGNVQILGVKASQSGYSGSYSNQAQPTGAYNGYATASLAKQTTYQRNDYGADNSGAYVHDPSGDYAEPYKHTDSPAEPYLHENSGYRASSDYYDYGKYKASSQSGYTQGDNGQYRHDNSGEYVDSGRGYKESSNGYKNDYSGAYNADYSGSYTQDHLGQYQAGVYRTDGHIGGATGSLNVQSYSQGNAGNYISDSKAYTGSSHTLTAGAVNVGLVGKTTLVDADYNNQNNYQGINSYTQSVSHKTVHPAHLNLISQPAVSIKHVGTDENNLDGYGYVTTPTSSGIPTTATPFAFTTALPTVTYKTTFVPEPPKSTVKQIFGYSQPQVTVVQPTVVAVKQFTPKIQEYNNQRQNYQYEGSAAQSQSYVKEGGYDYSKPSAKFEDGISYTTPAPVVVSTFKPAGFSHQTQHIETGYQYSTPVPITEEPFKRVVAYTTGAPETFAQSTVSYADSYSHQTVHNVQGNVQQQETYSGVTYEQPKVFQYTSPQPEVIQPVVSTYQPQIFSQQTLHNVDANRVNTYSQESGYKYEKPANTYSQDSSGYKYDKPAVKFEENAKVHFEPAPTVIQYSTPASVVSTYNPQAYSHQVLHKFESKPLVVSSTPLSVQYEVKPTPVTIYQNPILKYTAPKVTPVTYVQPTYNSQAYSHQTIHKYEDTKSYAPAVETGEYDYSKSTVSFEQPKTIQYTTSQPDLSVQPLPTYQPQVISHQTYHKVDAGQVKTHSQAESGYQYSQPSVQFEAVPQTVSYSTQAPVVSTYKPQTYRQQTYHKVESHYLPSSTPKVDYQPAVSTYENPIITYTKKVTPVTYVQPTATVFTQTYQPIVQQHEVRHEQASYETNQESYDQTQQSYEQNVQLNQGYTQPEETRSYSDANVVSHQTFHLDTKNNDKSGQNVVFVTTTPATLAYEEHYSEYEAPKKVESYKAPEYIPPKTEYQQTYSVSTAAPAIQQTVLTQDNYDINQYSQQYEDVQNTAQQVSFSTSHVTQPRVESIHLSTFPGTKVVTKYQQTYDNPEIQVQYKAEDYLPPVVSTVAPVTTTFRPRTYSTTTKEYLPPSTTREYLPPSVEYLPPAEPEYTREYLQPANTYLPSTTSRPVITTYKAKEYLPPVEDRKPNVINFESYGFNNIEATAEPKIRYSPYEEITVTQEVSKPVRKQNIVVETAKNLLGFGTVGPDAGLVSPVSYTTSAPIVSSTYRPIVKSTTQEPYFVESTTAYKAPEYLPPSEETIIEEYGFRNEQARIRINPYQENVSTRAPKRKQNIVVQTAKANQLGYGTVGSDAGLVSTVTYTPSTPVTSTESYTVAPQVISTFAPVQQGLFETTVPRRRNKPKVAVVTKINDFNPLLVRKLGAVCSCQSQSPVLVLKGTKINTPTPKDFDDYSNDYEETRGDIGNEWAQKSRKTADFTAAPIVTSTANPIIVPEDSYYQDYQDQNNYDVSVVPKQEVYVSTTPAVTSTERVVRIRPRIKAVTVAPTYKTVLLEQEVAPTAAAIEASAIDSQSFDRYGPGGWRSRDETLQGSVDCKRAGLFRHPKQCNKFYACRWDCTKQRFTLHVFNCPVQLSFDPSIGACNWPSQGPACQGDTLLTNSL